MSNYTPGPWTATGWKGTVVNDADGNTLALFPAGDSRTETAQANARLIAAAPDLLEACCAAESLLCEVWDAVSPLVSGGPDQVNNVADKLHAAIAKATQG